MPLRRMGSIYGDVELEMKCKINGRIILSNSWDLFLQKFKICVKKGLMGNER